MRCRRICSSAYSSVECWNTGSLDLSSSDEIADASLEHQFGTASVSVDSNDEYPMLYNVAGIWMRF